MRLIPTGCCVIIPEPLVVNTRLWSYRLRYRVVSKGPSTSIFREVTSYLTQYL